MSEFKGTKGKWSFDPVAKEGSYAAHELDFYFSECNQACLTLWCDKKIPNEEELANALLISKAPEMLKHLEMVIALEDLIAYPKDTKIEHSQEAQAIDEMIYLIKKLIKEATTI